MGGAAAAVIVMKERQLIGAFEDVGAISPDKGISEGDLRVDVSHIAWRRLRSRAVIRETSTGSGLYYLDREVWQAVRRTRLRLLWVVFILVAIAAYAASNGVAIFHAGVKAGQTAPAP